jgi:hypothetical protein
MGEGVVGGEVTVGVIVCVDQLKLNSGNAQADNTKVEIIKIMIIRAYNKLFFFIQNLLNYFAISLIITFIYIFRHNNRLSALRAESLLKIIQC